MARRRFFVTEVKNGGAIIQGDEARHLTRVLRVEIGQKYEVSDGAAAYLAEVAVARKEFVEFRVLEEVPAAPDVVRVTLLASLIKFDHFELLIEKATELGVAQIVPVITARTEAGLEKAVPKRRERWRRIAVEASQQSRRDHLPEISPAVSFEKALEGGGFWLDEVAGGAPLLSVVRNGPVVLLVGPEGGWTEGERAKALARKDWVRVTLGPQILRAETAGIASIAVVMAVGQAGIT